jgi:branched-chain amino acid transport system substrate-binding protein
MTEKSNSLLLWMIGIALIILGFVYFSVGGGKVDTIKIGVITPLSGDTDTYGMAVQRAYDLAVSEVNSAGGVEGKDIELVYEDGKCDGPTASVVAKKLIDEDGVKFILGGTCSGETLAAAAVTQEARVLLLSPFASSPAFTGAGDLAFRTFPSDALEAKMFADYAMDKGHERAAVVSENTDFAQGVREAFKAAYKGRVAFDKMYEVGETDFAALVSAMRAANPQMVYVVAQSPAAGELILKQIEEVGMNVAVFAPNSMLDRSRFTASPNLYEEVVLAEVQLPTSEKTTSMLAAYEAVYGVTPEFLALTASSYDAVQLLAEAIGKVGEDAQAVAGYFNDSIVDWEGTLGTLNFDENGDVNVVPTLVQVIGGEVVPLSVE